MPAYGKGNVRSPTHDRLMVKVERGVRRYSGITSKWFGWAQRGGVYREGDLRWLKLMARWDARKLARQLEQ